MKLNKEWHESNTRNGSPINNKQTIPFHSIIPFFLISFGLGWGILASFIFFPNQMNNVFGELTGEHPLFFLATWSPAIAALIIIIYKTGFKGWRLYLSRLLLWRCSIWWYIFIIIGIPLVFVGGSALKGNLFAEQYSFTSFQYVLTAFVLTAIKGPVEEFGWRGLALPLLQRKFTPILAALILGIIWGFWHLPAFLLSGTEQSQWSFGSFFIGCIALSIIVTPLFNASRGSIFLTAFFHFMLNNPLSPDAQPYDTYILIVVAVLVIGLYRNTMFRKEGAVTAVIPQKN